MSEELQGRRKYRAFLFSLASLTLLTAGGMLAGPEYQKGLAWILGIFGFANGVEHISQVFTVTEPEPES